MGEIQEELEGGEGGSDVDTVVIYKTTNRDLSTNRDLLKHGR